MSCRKQSHIWGQTRLLRDLCSRILKIFNDRHCITSLDNLYQSLSVLMQQNCTSTRFRVFLDWGHCAWHPVFCTNSVSFMFFSQEIWLKRTYIITRISSKRDGDPFLTLKLELLMHKAPVALRGKRISFSHLNVTAWIPLTAGRSIKGSLTDTWRSISVPSHFTRWRYICLTSPDPFCRHFCYPSPDLIAQGWKVHGASWDLGIIKWTRVVLKYPEFVCGRKCCWPKLAGRGRYAVQKLTFPCYDSEQSQILPHHEDK